MSEPKVVDVAIIGGGLTGWSCAYHVRRAGIKNVALMGPAPQQQIYRSAAQAVAYSCPVDNITRFAHAWGSHFAGRYWDFSQSAYDYTRSLLCQAGIPNKEVPWYRLILTESERKEAEAAVRELMVLGRKAALVDGVSAFGFTDGIAVQDSGDKGSIYAPVDLIKVLAKGFDGERLEVSVERVERKGGLYHLQLATGGVLKAQFVILANHLQIPELLGSLKDAFVSTAEQGLRLKCERVSATKQLGAFVNYGHEIYATLGDGVVLASGARFRRRHAGIGEQVAALDEQVSRFLEARVKSLWGFKNNVICEDSWAGLDCRPCDELPIIGPMFGEAGLLVSGGYMNQGFTLGLYAGRLLAELITQGRSDALLPELHPKRLRTLAMVD